MTETYTSRYLKFDVIWVVTLRRLVIEHCITWITWNWGRS